jgi:hypothetical protein
VTDCKTWCRRPCGLSINFFCFALKELIDKTELLLKREKKGKISVQSWPVGLCMFWKLALSICTQQQQQQL